ncbi:putative protein N(5)-glutamine methyltransferase [Myceligenerans salitolerans]|uniref:Release factor glutamine methyltransferase n=1 Tax=Myceligenerans salitolerans TaxID=1230528 RepID=A0ABS3IDV1_9MICO|nr:putative protein N(5)-glutamine methyltransferase [Myceligenerans salitolerans]MBO0611154.1 putative protein N(5)-glutamine methyltransferase [Myceligenerans salitolerans]
MHENPALVARLRAAGCVFAEDEARLLTEAAGIPAGAGTDAAGMPPGGRADPERLERLVAARIAGVPLEQVLGWAEFRGRRWTVVPGVFVPRRRSELLVSEALSGLRDPSGAGSGNAPSGTGTPGDQGRLSRSVMEPRAPGRAGRLPGTATEAPGTPNGPGYRTGASPGAERAGAVVVDLCCGCGALGGSVALDLADSGVDVELHVSDLDAVATGAARQNLAGLVAGPGPRAGRLTAVVHDGDLDAPLPRSLRGRVDVLLCNAPYVPSEAIALMPREAREHEPLLALDGGTDGLAVLRRAIAAAPAWLRPGGTLLFETGHDQAETTASAAREAGLTPRVVSDDDLGATVVVARRP